MKMPTPATAIPSPTQPYCGVGSPRLARMIMVKSGYMENNSAEEKADVFSTPKTNPS
jgi:hypothetical protein